MERFKIPDDQPMEAKIRSRQIEGAQKKVEEQNFVMRKNVLKYDDVMNRHRGRIYEQRRQVLEGEDMSDQVRSWIDEVVEDTVRTFTQEEYPEEWDLEALTNAMAQLLVQGQATNGTMRYEHETSAGAEAIAQAGGGEAVMSGVPSAGGVLQQAAVQASPHEKLGRNEPCWCGSGKKFKKCHGA